METGAAKRIDPYLNRAFSDKEALLEGLCATDISVPARSRGRTSDHTERWTICRLLATLSGDPMLSYPLTVQKRESPDYRIEMSNKVIGVEVTESPNEAYNAFSEFASREYPGSLHELSHFRRGQRRLSKSRSERLLQSSKLTGSGWQGDTPEREWALYVEGTICKKLQKIKEYDISNFHSFWLSVYANLPLGPVDMEVAQHYLSTSATGIFQQTEMLTEIFVEEDEFIINLNSSGAKRYRLNNVWN